MKKKIALVAGGYTGEYEISLLSAQTIAANLDPSKYEVYEIFIDTKNEWYCKCEGSNFPIDKNDFSLLLDGSKLNFDLVFIAIHGTPGEDGKFQGYLDMLNIPYTTCDAVVSALSFNKVFCNRVVQQSGLIDVARSMHLFKNRDYTTQDILNEVNLPLFVKPCEGGSSLATFKIKMEEELLPAVQKAFEFDNQVMAEEFISGRELTMGAYTKENEIVLLPATEIIPKNEFFDYESKYDGSTQEITPADISSESLKKVKQASIDLYALLNCKGVVRFDYIMDESQDRLYFLEVNTMPGQSAESIIPQQVASIGMNLREFYDIIIKESL